MSGCHARRARTQPPMVNDPRVSLRDAPNKPSRKALCAHDRLGGHIVSGHVDGIGTVTALTAQGESHLLQIAVPPELASAMTYKGSVSVHGVSLTINRVEDTPAGCIISINLIPHTMANTTLRNLQSGSHVNLEIDMLARYVQRVLSLRKHLPAQ